MTKLILTMILGTFLLSCKEDSPSIIEGYEQFKENEPSILRTQTFYQLDTLNANEVFINLKFDNIGGLPIKKFQIKNSCKCTTVDSYPDEIPPHSSIETKGKIDISDKEGYFSKNILVLASFLSVYKKYRGGRL